MDIQSSSQIDLKSRPLIFLDLETTGLQAQKHEIIEIGALKVEPKRPFKIVGELELKVRPKHIRSASKKALEINGYSATKWKNALGLAGALQILDEFGKEGVLVGYNVAFDWAFLDKAYFSLGRQDPFYYHRLDVMAMVYYKLFPQKSLKKFSLGEVCRYLRVERCMAHRALDDARVTYLVFKKLFGYTKNK